MLVELDKLEALLKGAIVTYKQSFDNKYHSFNIDDEAERLKRWKGNPYAEKVNYNYRIAVFLWNNCFEKSEGDWFIRLASEVKANLT